MAHIPLLWSWMRPHIICCTITYGISTRWRHSLIENAPQRHTITIPDVTDTQACPSNTGPHLTTDLMLASRRP
eukprot:1158758-Pelagomonas_calceolata.AAC.5